MVLRCSLIVAAALLLAERARAQDAFEIQVYDASVDERGHAGLELHLNYIARGLTQAASPELPNNHFFHVTLEPSIGVGHNWEIGGYLQAAAGPGSNFSFAGAKIRGKVRIPINDDWAFALNGELSYVPSRYEANIWGGELRPVIEFKHWRWLVDVNPILSFEWTGPYAGVPHFEPCAAVRFRLGERWMAGLEYYMALGPFSKLLGFSDEYQAAFATGDVALPLGFGIHFGVGTGFTAATSRLVIKSILSKEF